MIEHSLSEWRMQYREWEALDCRVPCSMYSVLLDNGLIPDPFYRLNERELTDCSRYGCIFSADVEVTAEMLAKKHVLLRFECLDTLGRAYVNGYPVGRFFNMHRTWEFDCKLYLVPGKNRVELRFEPPINYIEKENREFHIRGNAETTGDTMLGIAHIRKAGYMFGWDWAPKLPDMGILRPAHLIAFDTRIEEVRIRQGIGCSCAELEVETAVDGKADVIIRLYSPELCLMEQKAGASQRFRVESPQLWWPNGYGDQPLYTIEIQLLENGRPAETIKRRIGFRNLTINQETDAWGRNFCFEVNGAKIFAKGANYVPEDSLLARKTAVRTNCLLESCAAANFNCVRVWGGGQYPDDIFYDLCDEKGLIVWQDLMFACENVFITDEFLANTRVEFQQNLVRLRHHACLGLISGNNEMEVAQVSWYKNDPDIAIWKDHYIRFYERFIPNIMKQTAPDIFYWPSSPSSGGGFQDTEAENTGDQHYWDVWHGFKTFEDYRRHYFRFCSEYGYGALPGMNTIRSFSEPEDRHYQSEVMISHQKSKDGNMKVMQQLTLHYGTPSDFEGFVYAGQLLQGEAIRYGAEHFRRHRGRCMGSIYWQLNDCWPGASWASLDYYGNWKALHYFAKRFYAPILLSAHEKENQAVLNLQNETLEPFNGLVRWEIRDTDFHLVKQEEIPVYGEPLSSQDIASVQMNRLDLKKYYLRFLLFNKAGEQLADSTVLFVKPIDFIFPDPALSATVVTIDGKFYVQLTAKRYAKNVELRFEDIPAIFCNNFFDVADGEIKRIPFESPEQRTVEEYQTHLRLMSVYDISLAAHQSKEGQ